MNKPFPSKLYNLKVVQSVKLISGGRSHIQHANRVTTNADIEAESSNNESTILTQASATVPQLGPAGQPVGAREVG